jgi:hypothetical protein
MGDLAGDIKLLTDVKAKMSELLELQKTCNSEWGGEDGVYRFYHHSFKVYLLQGLTNKIVALLRSFCPEGKPLNIMFEDIITAGTGYKWDRSHNLAWVAHTRPIVDAYLHAKWVLDTMIKYGQELGEAPSLLPTGWAVVLYLYNMR